jgi:hypothetical protein
LFFQPEQYFSLTTNQPTVFFSRLISPAERGLKMHNPFAYSIKKNKEKQFTPIHSSLFPCHTFSPTVQGLPSNGQQKAINKKYMIFFKTTSLARDSYVVETLYYFFNILAFLNEKKLKTTRGRTKKIRFF